ncbi:MAG TPA: hypothetical protein PLV70_01710 [Flavobacteriales bacterium]|nr:hypothetical protein [Flavobacteriales bacterium]HRP82557.1 hypothetical protein [Flavobacteriales bacterium]HRQ83811.1 hypothetical protein [Flavobacteriales bacterium]
MGQVTDVEGHARPDIKFYTSGAVPRAYFREEGSFSLVLDTPGDSLSGVDTLRRLDLTLTGPNAMHPDPVVWTMKDQYAHFYLPQCGPNGATFVHPYHRVIYKGIYPHIDMHIYSGKIGQKIAFVINPGGDPKDIELQFEGQDHMDVDVYGNLKLLIADKWITIPQALAYQVANDGTILPVNWTATFNAYDGVGRAYFNFDAYHPEKPLVLLIGPHAMGGETEYQEDGLCWSTYYGGDRYDHPKDIKPDQLGNFYVAGRTESTWSSFPIVLGTSTMTHGRSLATLTKFNLDHYLLWTVYHGGNNPNFQRTSSSAIAIKHIEDQPHIYMVGTTESDGFLTHEKPGAYNLGSSDNITNKGFVAEYDQDGDLKWATYIGSQFTTVQSVDVRPTGGNLIISGTTEGDLGLPNPLTNFTYQGNGDAYVALFNAEDNVQWSAFYGGSGTESMALVRCNDDRVLLAGNTQSPDIQTGGTAPNFIEPYHGGQDIFILQLSYAGVRQWATYFGGPSTDELAPQGLGLAKDLYLTGKCGVLNTMVNGTGWYDNTPNGWNGFVARFRNGGNDPLWITYLGHGDNHSPYCLHVNNIGELTVGGYTNDPQFDPHYWPGHYFQTEYNVDLPSGPDQGSPKAQDGFLVRFTEPQERMWSTLFGGDAGGLAQPQNVVALHDIGGSIYAVGYTSMPADYPDNYFPLAGVENAGYFFNPEYNYQGLQGAYTDGFITEFCDQMFTEVGEGPTAAHDNIHALWDAEGRISAWGLEDGSHTLRVLDAQGRLIADRTVGSRGGRTEPLALRLASSALYLLVVDNKHSIKLATTH